MSTTPNLLINLLTESQNHKEVTVNTALDDLDGTLTGEFVQAMGDANQTLSDANALYNVCIKCTGAMTANRYLIVPPNKHFYIINNDTTGGYDIIVSTTVGSPAPVEVLIPVGATLYVLVYCDGTNIFQVGTTTSSASFIGLSDVPASYGGAAYDAVQVNSAATALVFVAKPFDVMVYQPGVGSNAQVLLYIKLTRTVVFPASAANSYAVANTAATGTTTFTLKKNGTSFATVVFSASGTTGAWTQAADATFAPGDILEIDGQAVADATLANFGISLYGIRH